MLIVYMHCILCRMIKGKKHCIIHKVARVLAICTTVEIKNTPWHISHLVCVTLNEMITCLTLNNVPPAT